MKCFISHIKELPLKNGSILKLQPYDCTVGWGCIDYFNKVMFKSQKLTEQGLMAAPNPRGPDLVLKYLSAKCHHPQKAEIKKHIASLGTVGVLIPTDLLGMIDKVAETMKSGKSHHAQHVRKLRDHVQDILIPEFRLTIKLVSQVIDSLQEMGALTETMLMQTALSKYQHMKETLGELKSLYDEYLEFRGLR